MTVSSSISQSTHAWTGAETTFATGIPARDAGQFAAVLVDAGGLPYVLTRGVHYSFSIVAGLAVLAPIAMPAGSGTMTVTRQTSIVQDQEFPGDDNYDPDAHELAHDLAAMRLAELRRDTDLLKTKTDALDTAVAAAQGWSASAQGYATTAAGYVTAAQGYAAAAAASAAAAATFDPASYYTKAAADGRYVLLTNVGTGNNKIVAFDNAGKYPTADGSQITGVVAASLVANATVAASPASADNTTKVATTAWVRSNIRNKGKGTISAASVAVHSITSIPAGVDEITLLFAPWHCAAASSPLTLRLAYNGGATILNSGYSSSLNGSLTTTGFRLHNMTGDKWYCSMLHLRKVNSTWCVDGCGYDASTGAQYKIAGQGPDIGANNLDTLIITTESGADIYNLGTIGYSWG